MSAFLAAGPDVDAPTVALSLNLLWIVIGAALVIFMQAGFAMVETGFCRSKHAAHVVSTNFMIFGLGFVAFFFVGFAFMFGGFSLPGVFGMDAPVGGSLVKVGDWVFLWKGGFGLGGSVTGVDRVDHGVLPLHGRLHGHDGDDPDRGDGRALEVVVVRGVGPVLRRDLLPALRSVDLGRRLAQPARQQRRPRLRLRRLRRLRRGARGRRCGGARRAHRARTAHRQVRQGRHAAGAARPQHPDGDVRHVHPAVRLVRLQRRFDVRGDRHPVRDGGGQHRHRRCVRFGRRAVLGDASAPASPTRR